MNTVSTIVIGVIVLAQICLADQQKSNTNESLIESAESQIKPVTSNMKNAANQINSQVEDNDLTKIISNIKSQFSEDQFKIINLCADIPFKYDKIVYTYMNLPENSADIDEKLKQEINNFQSETESLKKLVNEYVKSSSEGDSIEEKSYQSMVSAINDLKKLSGEMMKNVSNHDGQQSGNHLPDMQNRAKFVENSFQPAMTKLSEFCVSQAKDMMQNVGN